MTSELTSADEPSASAANRPPAIIVIGASTGGVEALIRLASGLREDLPAALFVVLHLSPQAPSHLPQILSRAGVLSALHPADGEPILPGRIYVAPPDRHLLVERGRIRLSHGPRENRHRPAIDPLFRSAAVAYGPDVIGVVLTGALDDGTAGLQAIKQRGGIAVVQDPDDALIPSMPASALEYVDVDYCVPLKDIAPLLTRLADTATTRESAPPASPEHQDELQVETSVAKMENGSMSSDEQQGELVGFTCPECGGPLYELRDGRLVRYRCRVGHAFTGENLLAGQLEALEDALWAAYNTLRESALVAERLAADAERRGHDHVASHMKARAAQQRKRADAVHAVIGEGNGTVPAVNEDEASQSEAAQEA